MKPKDVLLFVYATLKSRGIQRDILGHDARVVAAPRLTGYDEITRSVDGEDYPTLIPKPSGAVRGEVFEVSPVELHELDAWEENYERMRVFPHYRTPVYTYVLRGGLGDGDGDSD